MNEQLEFVKQIATRLDSASIAYMMTGSMAMTIYSTPRMTRDIDLVVELTPGDVDKIVGLFSDDCYVDRHSVEQAARSRGMFNIIHNEWVIKADFIVRKDDEYRKAEFTRRQIVVMEGTPVWVVTPEDLLLSKLAWAKRGQSQLQLRDVQSMLASTPDLDLGYVQKWAEVIRVHELLREAMEDG